MSDETAAELRVSTNAQDQSKTYALAEVDPLKRDPFWH